MRARDDKLYRCPAIEPKAPSGAGYINLAHNGSLTRALRDIYPVGPGQWKVICMSLPIFWVNLVALIHLNFVRGQLQYSVSSLVVPKMEDEFSGTDAGKNSK